MDTGEKVIGALVPSTWSDKMTAHFRKMPSCAMAAPLEWYREGVARGDLRLLHYYIDGRSAGGLVYRLDPGPGGVTDFVIIAAVAPGHLGMSLVEIMMPGLERYAKNMGCKRVRAHTSRQGLVKRLHDAGYVQGEIVMIKDLV